MGIEGPPTMEKDEPTSGEHSLENLNSPEEEQKIEQGIAKAETLDDLINLFENNKGIMGSSKFYDAKEIIEQIETAKNDKFVIPYITGSLGLRNKIKQILEAGKSSEEQVEINKIKKEIETNEIDLEQSETALEKMKDSEKMNRVQALEERIKYTKDKIQGLKDDLELLESKEVNSINDIGNKRITIFKMKMKSGEGSKVQRGEEYSGFSMKDNIKVDDGIYLEEDGEFKIKTSRIKSIKECKDGSYIAETDTSFYRVNISEDEAQDFENDLDTLEGEEIDSIDGIGDREITISKVKMKDDEASEVNTGREFSGFSVEENIIVNDQIYLEKDGNRVVSTSRIKSIKKRKDGSYIIETGTSFYKLSINA